ncbi:ATP-grasp domain-containing protein [Fodinibius sp. SL11]|uniref:ATP-grasp domain-containing protein n=1 Tax=Fodinibius sp. SL11 TaxID=3425690 RepID=UPI003F884BE4
MKIAIHHKENDFSSKWIEYCQKNSIPYGIVDCYNSDIIDQMKGFDALMWHFNQSNPKEVLFAKQLLYSLQIAGKLVFPDFHTAWHFDDKVGQKYLLESIKAPLVPSYVFYDKEVALKWVGETDFPKVFKLRRGAGSAHVKLVRNKSEAKKLIYKAFGRGFSQYNKITNLKERWYKYRKGHSGFWNVIKGIIRLGYSTEFAKIVGNERGYSYFQDFIENNDHDIRVIVINEKAFGIKRLVREGDFRASGSGDILYEKKYFDEEVIQLSFEVAERINSQCLAIDYVFKNGEPLIVEISYGFVKEGYYPCKGYWDKELTWHEGAFNAQGWMVEALLAELELKLMSE